MSKRQGYTGLKPEAARRLYEYSEPYFGFFDPDYERMPDAFKAPDSSLETDEELRKRVYYVAGRVPPPLPGGAELEQIAARYGLKRRGREHPVERADREIWGSK